MRDGFLFELFFLTFEIFKMNYFLVSSLICFKYFYSLVLQQNWNFSTEKVLIQHVS